MSQVGWNSLFYLPEEMSKRRNEMSNAQNKAETVDNVQPNQNVQTNEQMFMEMMKLIAPSVKQFLDASSAQQERMGKLFDKFEPMLDEVSKEAKTAFEAKKAQGKTKVEVNEPIDANFAKAEEYFRKGGKHAGLSDEQIECIINRVYSKGRECSSSLPVAVKSVRYYSFVDKRVEAARLEQAYEDLMDGSSLRLKHSVRDRYLDAVSCGDVWTVKKLFKEFPEFIRW